MADLSEWQRMTFHNVEILPWKSMVKFLNYDCFHPSKITQYRLYGTSINISLVLEKYCKLGHGLMP